MLRLSVHRLLIGQHVGQIGGIHPLVAIQRLVQVVIRRNQLVGRMVAADRVGVRADPDIGGLRAEDLLVPAVAIDTIFVVYFAES